MTATLAYTTPDEAWNALREGNTRFSQGNLTHPHQDPRWRAELAEGQAPFASLFGCSDSRAPLETVFDLGLGDAFVVRNAGHVINTAILGSIEFGVEILGTPLLVVAGHQSCGAVGAAYRTLTAGELAPGLVRTVVDGIIPSSTFLPAGALEAPTGAQELGREHTRNTVDQLYSYSGLVRAAVDEGRCAIVGVEYSLEQGRVLLHTVRGQLTANLDIER